MLPGHNGKIVATFISSSTSPAAGSGAWMSNARMATYTASSWRNQPVHWSRIAPAAGAGALITDSPCRAIPSSRRNGLALSSPARSPRRALRTASVKSVTPTMETTARLVTAQVGIFAVIST